MPGPLLQRMEADAVVSHGEVNGRGLEIRLRLPSGTDALEPGLRRLIGAAVSRGSVTFALALEREALGGDIVVNRQALKTVLVRVSGQRDAATRVGDINDPRKYVQRFGFTADNMLEVGFDSASIDHLLSSAGLPFEAVAVVTHVVISDDHVFVLGAVQPCLDTIHLPVQVAEVDVRRNVTDQAPPEPGVGGEKGRR